MPDHLAPKERFICPCFGVRRHWLPCEFTAQWHIVTLRIHRSLNNLLLWDHTEPLLGVLLFLLRANSSAKWCVVKSRAVGHGA